MESKKLYTKSSITNHILFEIERICNKDHINFTKENFQFCYVESFDSIFLGTTDSLYQINIRNKGIFYLAIPLSRILKVFSYKKHYESFLIFDVSTENDLYLTYGFEKEKQIEKIEFEIVNILNKRYTNEEKVLFKNAIKDTLKTESEIISLQSYYDEKIIDKVRSLNSSWFNSSYESKIKQLNSKVTFYDKQKEEAKKYKKQSQKEINNKIHYYNIALEVLEETNNKVADGIYLFSDRTGYSPVDSKGILDYVISHYAEVTQLCNKHKYTTSELDIQQEFTDNIDYDNMSIEELQAQIEKEKLIAELKKLKAENSGVPAQQPKQVSQPKIVERPVSPIVSRPSRLDPQCPKCHSTNIVLIDNDVGDTKIVGNINPLHPLTIATVKKKPKKVRSKGKTVAAIMTGGLSMAVTGGTKKKVTQQWYCQDCGKKWYK